MYVKRLTVKYEGTSDIPTDLASKDVGVVLDYVDFLLRTANCIEHVGIDFVKPSGVTG